MSRHGFATDPDFDGPAAKTAPDRGVPTFALWIFIYRLQIAVGLFALLLFLLLPIIQPFHTVERLNPPVAVVGVTDKALALADGRSVSLPFVKRIPRDDPCFRGALKQGVEVEQNGAVFGLLTVYPSCGMTAYGYSIRRVNLSELVGVLRPDSIDEYVIPPEQVKDFPEYLTRPDGRVRDSVWHPLHRWHELFESQRANAAPQPNPTLTITTP